jgi:hypothetical protein
MLPDSAKMNYLKQSWLSNDHSSELALANLLNKKPPSSTGKREQQRIYREKKMSYMSNQLNDSSFQSKMGDSHLKLKDASKYLDLKDLRIGPSLSRDLQKLGLIVRQEALTHQKLRPDKSQELKANSQFQTPMYASNYAVQGQENKEKHHNEIPEEQRPIGTEEYYEEFFSTHKMTFDFEKQRVSQRTGKKKDYYTPEPTPSNANAGLKNYFSNREAPNTLSYRPSEEKVMRVRYVD